TGVIAPAAAGIFLRASAIDDGGLRLHSAQGVAHCLPRIVDGREDQSAGEAVAEGNVAHLVHSNRAHPAKIRIAWRTGESPRLIHGGDGRAFRRAEFIPSLAHLAGGGSHVVAHYPRLVIAEVAVSEA